MCIADAHFPGPWKGRCLAVYRCIARLCIEEHDVGLQWMHTGVLDKAGLDSLNQPCLPSDEAELKIDTCTMVTVRYT